MLSNTKFKTIHVLHSTEFYSICSQEPQNLRYRVSHSKNEFANRRISR
jgi:hypothetical protein